MAGAREVVELVFSASNTKAINAIKQTSDAAAKAEQSTSRMGKALSKVGVDGGKTMDFLASHAKGFAIGAGAAIATFAAKSVADFQRLALGADKFARATGLAVEDASRWIEVAGDMGISTEATQGALAKFTKGLDANRKTMQQYGIAIEVARDGTTNVQATLLNAIGALSKMRDGADRSALAAKLFGRGWTEVAELVTSGAGAVERALGDVSEAKVIDKDEVARAKELRKSMDSLGDAVQDVSLELGGQLVPALATATEGMAHLLAMTTDLGRGLREKLPGPIEFIANAFTGGFSGAFQAVEKSSEAVYEATEAWSKARQAAISSLSPTEQLTQAVEDQAAASADVAKKMAAQEQALFSLRSAQEDAFEGALNLAESIRRAGEALGEYTSVQADATATDIAKARAGDDVWRTINAVANAAGEQARKMAEASGKTLTAAMADRAKIDALAELARQFPQILAYVDAYRTKLGLVPSRIVTEFVIKGGGGGVGFQVGGETVRGKATGGRVSAGTPYLVGETRPELFVPDRPGRIVPHADSAGAAVVVNVAGTVITERDLVDAIHQGLLRKQATQGGLGLR